jgi:hypothetical protein
MKSFLLVFSVFAAGLIGCGAAQAQLSLPSSVESAPADAPAKPAGAKKAHKPAKAKPATLAAPSVDSIVGHPLLQNGADGQLLFSSQDKGLQIDKFTLPGEVVSDPKQKCRIDIVAETPIEARSQGAPDGLERYSADIPACPLTFDVLNGAVLVPAQTTACVFQAADCQASPSGLWGPDGATLEKDAKSIAKTRSRMDSSIAESLRLIETRDKGASSAGLTRDQIDFASQRDELCRDYAAEARHGFCAAAVTEARAALLRKRAEEPKRKGAESTD